MAKQEKLDLFKFMLSRVKETQKDHLDGEPQAFGRWFSELFFMSPHDIFISDGSRDGKIDLFFTTNNGESVLHHVLNTKFTKEFNKIAPPSFYHEIKYFWHAFENREVRGAYLEKAVKSELRPRYNRLFERYDDGAAELMFVTNHRSNDPYFEQVKNIAVKVFHLDDLIQCLIDDIDGAMPHTPPISLNGVHAVLSPDKADTEVATSIVFARLVDFIDYMNNDPFDLLFNRNVRVAISVSRSTVNRAIRDTFESNPKEFAFSNNGITMLCERQHWDPGQKILTLDNPRVVNGSQTLHSIRDVPNPSANARVMVRVIEINPPRGDALEESIRQRKEVIRKIAVRSNQQNPIKAWDLAANDDFQLDLFRFFRSKGYFYERRRGEWKQRSRELKNVNIKYGDSIKPLTQLMASYYWSKLGPALAKNVANLFEGSLYEAICTTPPEVAFQLSMIGDDLLKCGKELAKEKLQIGKLKSYGRFATFTLATRALQMVGADFGNATFSDQLLSQRRDWKTSYRSWKGLTKLCTEEVLAAYKREAALHPPESGELTYANYFKSQSSMRRLADAQPGENVKRAASAVPEA